MSYIYLTSPYTHPDKDIRELRYHRAMSTTAFLLAHGHHVYSPIVHNHAMAQAHNLPMDYSFWAAYNKTLLTTADTLVVLTLKGWEESVGVSAEIDIAKNQDKLIIYKTYPLESF